MKPTTKRLAIGFSLVLAWAVFMASRGSVGGGDLKPPTLETLDVSASANFQWMLFDIEGKPVKLSEFEGRPILLNLWATWCPPCLKEMPSLSKLAENPRIKAKGIVILCVSTDESPVEFKNFLQDHAWKMNLLRATSLPPAFETEFIPATFLIAPDGRIVASHVGPAQWDDASVVEFLEKLTVK